MLSFVGGLRIIRLPGFLVAMGMMLGGTAARAEDGTTDAIADYFSHWFERVDRMQATQPHWATPLATTTPRITEQFRYDQADERLPNGSRLNIYENGKGLDLIPWDNVGIMLGVPPYETRSGAKPAQGWGDWPFFRIKYRIASANEQDGNYIVTAYVQGTAPTGMPPFTTDAYAVTPTLALGKGWGDFDVQTTLGVNLPTNHVGAIGRSFAWNTAFQYHLWDLFWPELEVNTTAWQDGPRAGKHQVLLTTGVVIGRIPLVGRTSLTIGAGYQFAVSPTPRPTAAVPTLDNAILVTTHLTF